MYSGTVNTIDEICSRCKQKMYPGNMVVEPVRHIMPDGSEICDECLVHHRSLRHAKKHLEGLPGGDRCTYRSIPLNQFTNDELYKIVGECILHDRDRYN